MSRPQNFTIRQDTATGLFGIIKNDTDAWAIKPKYISIDPVESTAENAANLFIVRVNGKYQPMDGLVNATTGTELLECAYSIEQKPFLSGYDYLLKIEYRFKDSSANTGLFNLVTQEIFMPCEYAGFKPSSISPAYITVEIYKDRVKFAGLIDGKTGKLLLDCRYELDDWSVYRYKRYVHAFKFKGQHPIRDMISGQFGVVDEKLQFLLPIEYYFMENGYLAGDENDADPVFFYLCRNKYGKAGVLDQQFKTIIPFEYDDLILGSHLFLKNDNHNSIAIACKDNLWGVIDYENKVRISLVYEYVNTARFAESLSEKNKTIDFKVTKNYLSGICDLNDRMLIPMEYSMIEDYVRHKYSYVVKKGNKYGIVTIDNEMLLPLEYSLILPCGLNDGFSTTLYEIKKNKKIGLYDVVKKDGLEPAYTKIEDIIKMDGGYWIQVAIEQKAGFVDPKGKFVIEPVYEAFWYGGFIHGVIGTKKDGKWGLIDHTGKIIVPFEYAAISNTSFRGSKTLLFKADESLPFCSFHLDELLAPGGAKSLAAKASQVQPYSPSKDGLKILEGIQLIYEQGDFDALDDYKIQLGSIAPDLVFSFGFKRNEKFIDTVVVNKKLLQSSHKLQDLGQGDYNQNEASCPIFRISEKMYTELKEKKRTSVTGMFAFPEEGYIVAGENKKKKVKINKSNVEIQVLQGQVFEGENNPTGKILVLDNPDFPLVIQLEIYNESCHIKLKEVTV